MWLNEAGKKRVKCAVTAFIVSAHFNVIVYDPTLSRSHSEVHWRLLLGRCSRRKFSVESTTQLRAFEWQQFKRALAVFI